jgi:hypothetical protein
MSRRSGAGNALTAAQEALGETAEQLKALTARRREVLLTGSDEEVAAVDAEIEAAQRQQRTRSDRVSVLIEAAEQEAAARRAKEHAALIGRVEAKLAERDAIVAELAAHAAAADAALVKLFAANKAVLAGWPWENGHVGAALLGAGDTVRVLSNEIYRIGGRAPSTGGAPGDPRGPSFPGGKRGNLSWVMMPERSSPPMIARFAEASAAASVIMKTGRNAPAPATIGAVHPAMNGHATPPAEQPTPSSPNPPQAAPQKMGPEMLALLEKQNALVSGPMGPAEDEQYESISKRIRELAELGEGVSP